MTYLRECWYVAAHAEEASQKPFSRIILEEPVVIFRTESGQLTALDNRCPHRFASLSAGKVCGESIQCPYHGLQFNTAGACISVPSGDEPPQRARVKVYPVVEQYGLIWIWMGSAEKAHPKLIPDFSRLVADDCDWWTGYLYARANYQLVVDNLLDLSHVEFLHPMLASEGWAGRNTQSIEQRGDTVTVKDVALNDNASAMALQLNPGLSAIGTSSFIERWDPPSHLYLSVDYFSETGDWLVPSGHFLTPETSTTTHYFLRAGQSIDPKNSGLTATMKLGTLHVFQTEDIAMIETQQRNLGDADLMDMKPVILRADSGAVRARRILAKKINDERTTHSNAVSSLQR